MKKVPVDVVVVAPHRWSIQHDPDLLAALGGDGATLATTLRMIVDENQAGDFLKETILHEAMHGMYGQTPLFENSEEGKLREESVISALSPRIFGFLRDNPELVAWMLEVEVDKPESSERETP